jgi:hypothetical protein
MFKCFQSLSVSVKVSDGYVNVLCVIVFFSISFSFLDMILFFKSFLRSSFTLSNPIFLPCVYPQLLFILGGKEVGGLLVIILQF